MCCAWVGILRVCAEKHLPGHKADQEVSNFIYTRFIGWAQGENNPWFILKSALPHTLQRPRGRDQGGCEKAEMTLKAHFSSEMWLEKHAVASHNKLSIKDQTWSVPYYRGFLLISSAEKSTCYWERTWGNLICYTILTYENSAIRI